MSLPLKPLPMIERWDCHQCGVCCKGSLVPLTPPEVERLKQQGWHERPEFRGTPVVVNERTQGQTHRLAQRADGSCVFLLPDGLCRIHKELGFDAKPLICRMFPLQVVPRDNVAMVTLRRACPSAAADLGRTVAEQLDFARELARERHLADEAPQPPPLKKGLARGWPAARRMLTALERLLTDQRFPPVRRLVHALTLCRLFEEARTSTFDDKKLGELLDLLAENVAGEVGELFSNRQPPSGSGAILFRQTAAEFLRLHPRYIARPSWGQRWRLIAAAWKLVRGKGTLPRLHPDLPMGTFADLERPLGLLAPAVYLPLDRLIETSAQSWSYALANRGGWSIVESLRMLALWLPIGLWMLRWISIGRDPTAADLPEIITALDRGQGFASLSGPRQRWRLQTLARLGDLERLVIWHIQ
jgi:lysine-N-methylase